MYPINGGVKSETGVWNYSSKPPEELDQARHCPRCPRKGDLLHSCRLRRLHPLRFSSLSMLGLTMGQKQPCNQLCTIVRAPESISTYIGRSNPLPSSALRTPPMTLSPWTFTVGIPRLTYFPCWYAGRPGQTRLSVYTGTPVTGMFAGTIENRYPCGGIFQYGH